MNEPHPLLMETIERPTNGNGNGVEEIAKEYFGAQWPDPLSSEAFHGLAGEIVRAIEPHTEADPVSLLIQLLTAFGNVAGRGSYFIPEADIHNPNLFCVLVSSSPGSVKKALSVTNVPISTGSSGALIASTVGETLFTVIFVTFVPKLP